MAIFNRQDTPAESLATIQSDLLDLKASQIVGGDNIVVLYQEDQVLSQSISAGVAGVWKATYTYDEPSNAYTPIYFSWFAFGTFQFNQFTYDDPDTINGTTSTVKFISITPSANITLNFLTAAAKSTSSGTLSLTRIS